MKIHKRAGITNSGNHYPVKTKCFTVSDIINFHYGLKIYFFQLTEKYIQMFTLFLGDQSWEVQLWNEPEEGQGFCMQPFELCPFIK